MSCGGAIEKWWDPTGHCLCFESQMCINGKFGERIDSVTIGWRCVVDVELYRERRSLERHWWWCSAERGMCSNRILVERRLWERYSSTFCVWNMHFSIFISIFVCFTFCIYLTANQETQKLWLCWWQNLKHTEQWKQDFLKSLNHLWKFDLKASQKITLSSSDYMFGEVHSIAI